MFDKMSQKVEGLEFPKCRKIGEHQILEYKQGKGWCDAPYFVKSVKLGTCEGTLLPVYDGKLIWVCSLCERNIGDKKI